MNIVNVNLSVELVENGLGCDCTNNNGLFLDIGVLSFYIINGDQHHTVFAGFRYLSVYIKTF